MPISWTLLKELLYISSCSCFMANDQLEHISFALLNVRSLANKPFIINDIVNSCSIDIFFQQDILIFFKMLPFCFEMVKKSDVMWNISLSLSICPSHQFTFTFKFTVQSSKSHPFYKTSVFCQNLPSWQRSWKNLIAGQLIDHMNGNRQISFSQVFGLVTALRQHL